ncbi:hypothetical protein [Pectobacterium aroidearum]|uniref:hypothetical protein n=1 Tax=Pectobacterium aroidearum TaxID=1201031 RepID=UPI002A7F9FF4|nr:hypothetical protein [Pectobacterium aroidearum]MDY4387860.1 hypothetical protein [Pectobacterium aroidearum]
MSSSKRNSTEGDMALIYSPQSGSDPFVINISNCDQNKFLLVANEISKVVSEKKLELNSTILHKEISASANQLNYNEVESYPRHNSNQEAEHMTGIGRDEIQAHLKASNAEANAAVSQVNAAVSQVNAVASEVRREMAEWREKNNAELSQLTISINGLSSKIDGKIDSIDGKIQGIQGQVSGINTAISGVQSGISTKLALLGAFITVIVAIPGLLSSTKEPAPQQPQPIIIQTQQPQQQVPPRQPVPEQEPVSDKPIHSK